MRRAAVLAGAALLACAPPPPRGAKAIIGATLLDGRGGAPVSDSVVLVRDGVVVAAGARATTPVPAGYEKIDASGRTLVPPVKGLPVGGTPDVHTLDEAAREILSGGRPFTGTIEPGSTADMLLLNGNPMDDPRSLLRIHRVMRGGEWADR